MRYYSIPKVLGEPRSEIAPLPVSVPAEEMMKLAETLEEIRRRIADAFLGRTT